MILQSSLFEGDGQFAQGAIELLNALIVHRPTHSFGGGVGRRKGNGQSSSSRCHSPPPTFLSYRLKTLKVEPNPTTIGRSITHHLKSKFFLIVKKDATI